MLAGFEDVIIRALEKQQPASAAMREQVYNSARATLANMLNKSGTLSQESIYSQQQKLEMAIADIEAKYQPIELVGTDIQSIQSAVEPEINTDDRSNTAYEEQLPKPFWRRPFSLLLFGTIILAAFGISAWWIYDQGLTKPASLRDNSVPNPPKILAEEDSTEFDDDPNDREWLTIFEPKDPTGLITPNASTAVLTEDEYGSFVRLKTSSSDLQRSFQFVVDPGIIEAARGKTAVIDISAKSSNQDSQQFIVTCQFGAYGNCGRNRFTTERAPKSFTIEKKFSDKDPDGVLKGGTISIIVDISGQGAPLDVYTVRVKFR